MPPQENNNGNTSPGQTGQIVQGYPTQNDPQTTTPDPQSGFPDAQAHQAQQQQAATQTQMPSPQGLPQEEIERIREETRQQVLQEVEQKFGNTDQYETRIQQLENELRQSREERQQQEQAEQAEVERQQAEQRRQEEQEMDAKTLLERKDQEWQERFQALQEERERDRAIFERERQQNVLDEYKNRRLQEEADNVAPQFLEYVTGGSEQEIEESLSRAKANTADIFNSIQEAQQQHAAEQERQRQQTPGTRFTAPPGGPIEEQETGQRTLTAEDIKNMSPAEYARNRDALLREASRRGLYG